jgi:hypothetical protein
MKKDKSGSRGSYAPMIIIGSLFFRVWICHVGEFSADPLFQTYMRVECEGSNARCLCILHQLFCHGDPIVTDSLKRQDTKME